MSPDAGGPGGGQAHMTQDDRNTRAHDDGELASALSRGLVAGYLRGHCALPHLDREAIEDLLSALETVRGARVLPRSLSDATRHAVERLPGTLQQLSVVAAEPEALLDEVRRAAERAHASLAPDEARGYGELVCALAELGADRAGAALRTRSPGDASSAREALGAVRTAVRSIRADAAPSLVPDLDDEITHAEVTWYRSAVAAEDAGRRVIVVPLIVRSGDELVRALSYELDAYLSHPAKHEGALVFAIDAATLPESEDLRARAESLIEAFLATCDEMGIEHPGGLRFRISLVWQSAE